MLKCANYIYAGGKLLRETITEGETTKTLDFTYDNVGMPYSLIYNNGTTATTYYYVTNLQGDVMYLVDASGNEVAAYDYDPYGKVINATGVQWLRSTPALPWLLLRHRNRLLLSPEPLL